MVCITTDSGANIVKPASLNKWTGLQCFGHRLHSAIGAAGKDKRVEKAVGVCKKVVSAFSYSWKKKRELFKAQERLLLPKHQLVTESPTRWGSRQKMVARVLEQQKAIAEVLFADKNNRHLIPTWQDIGVLESLHEALTPLLEFTDSLSGESYVTVSYVKLVLHLFRTDLLNEKDQDTQLTKDLKTTIMTYLDEKYADSATDDLLNMAAFVDPRFKAQYISPEKEEAIKERAVSEMLDENTGQSEAEVSEGTAGQGAEGEAATPLPLGVKKQPSLGSFFKKQSQDDEEDASPLTERQKVENELKSYLKCLDTDSESDPLEWWKVYERKFPRMSQLAKGYLCIPATSTPSEIIFSTGGNIVTCTRAALKPGMVNQLVFLAQNLQ
ncbi:E3 SUMO-protein ligase ZBED1 [Nerophis lumbriciformis]|uniref:E3 SUMO-protein ligase ZBED1 n=1 Tax=Nerophis lumbriciformis TaxID=546530 RepID=UPI002AE04FEE|nr:E3 SUMO-protein ligase ZBED1 [Nerophis lumbriciformis]